ncbi:MAG: NifU family protein [Myxococcota bacterium]|nr:NifU family protein [Myxococcota bacterium]
MQIHTERTPNPASVKWVLGQCLLEGGVRASFLPGTPGEVSPLAARILAVPGVTQILVGADTVTVSKSAEVEGWREVGQAVTRAIEAWGASGEPVLGEAYVAPAQESDDAVEAKIRSILAEEIAPYVEQDGGEISLVGFRNGIVEVSLQGACQGCPSSAVTLKLGVEARLREEIPEVQAVVAV